MNDVKTWFAVLVMGPAWLYGSSLGTTASVQHDSPYVTDCSNAGTTSAQCHVSGVGDGGQGFGDATASAAPGNLSVDAEAERLPFVYEAFYIRSDAGASFSDVISVQNVQGPVFIRLTAVFAGGASGDDAGGGNMTLSLGGQSCQLGDNYVGPEMGGLPDPFPGSDQCSVTTQYAGQYLPLSLLLSSSFHVDFLDFGGGQARYTATITSAEVLDANLDPIANAILVSGSGFAGTVTATPEPRTMAGVGVLVAGFWFFRRRKG